MTEPPLAKRGRWLRGGNRPDPCRWLPEELLCRITSCLDARSLLNLGAVSRYYRSVCYKNQAGWEHLCRHKWKTKIHVSPQAVKILQQTEHDKVAALRAYRVATEDAEQRQSLRMDEFCYDLNPTAVWSFRFKESAGTDWTSADPWFRGLPCREMVFFSNGKVQQFIAEDDDHNQTPADAAASTTTTTLLFGKPVRRGQLVDPPVTTTWRFLTRPMDLPRRARGSYVRFTVAGRDVPTYSVRRSPNGNWGFVMESCWGLYASFPMPPRKRRHLRRTSAGDTAWVRESDEDEREHEVEETSEQLTNGSRDMTLKHDLVHPRTAEDDPLQDDTQLLITNEVQWREAFLYNVGARVLPEGDRATDEFDRAWGGV